LGSFVLELFSFLHFFHLHLDLGLFGIGSTEADI
jgi:hypothetical protein